MARLRMTNADYVAIAVSPALVMALVGSLVFFLIEVMYVGDYSLRLNYVFALFVFATVLIARIAIELGSELAAMYSLPLGILTYLALLRFVEHRTPFSWLVNLGLLAVVWWCAHKLTWDCTVIDDNEDSSGEGLLGRVGLDGSPDRGADPAPLTMGNKLLADQEKSRGEQWWRRLFRARQGPHSPGVWVLYFSLAALPLFGVGQLAIPAADVGRRRYAFGLLAVYVAAALSLLVTTSFLGLRRYLRQRRVEMPTPMAATWVSLGAVLIVLVMFVAALLPRPNAELAISQVPWQAGSPAGLRSSRYSVGREGTVDDEAAARVTSDAQDRAPVGPDAATSGQASEKPAAEQGEGQGESAAASQSAASPADSSPGRDQSGDRGSDQGGGQADGAREPAKREPAEEGESTTSDSAGSRDRTGEQRRPSKPPGENQQGADSPANDEAATEQGGSGARPFIEHAPPDSPSASQLLQAATSSAFNLIKLVLYAVLAAALVALAWRYRREIARAIADILQMFREFWARLLGRQPRGAAEGEAAAVVARRRSFSEFTDPFLTDRHRQLPPVELVRYTFEAFEAWAGDHGRPRTPDQTPQELLRAAVNPQTPMYEQASLLVRLYGEAAYASRNIPREAANKLRDLWHAMQSTPPRDGGPAISRERPTAPAR